MIPNSGSIQVLFIQTYSTEHLKFAKLYARHSGTTTIIAAHVSEMIIERDSTLFTLYNRPLYNAYYILITVWNSSKILTYLILKTTLQIGKLRQKEVTYSKAS